jgi:hypothetical protein
LSAQIVLLDSDWFDDCEAEICWSLTAREKHSAASADDSNRRYGFDDLLINSDFDIIWQRQESPKSGIVLSVVVMS